MGRLVCAIARQQSGLSGAAEQLARRDTGCAEYQHLCTTSRSRARQQHRPDDQRAASDDTDRSRENGADTDLLRLQDVRAISVDGQAGRNTKVRVAPVNNGLGHYCLRNWTSNLLTSPGRSCCTQWPAPSTKCVPSIRVHTDFCILSKSPGFW